jgi:hypothetical protein
MSAPELTVKVQTGESGVRAECVEFGVSVVASSSQAATRGLKTLVKSHCVALINRNGTGPGTPKQLKIAEQLLLEGVSWRVLTPDATTNA